MPLVEVRNVTKSFRKGEQTITPLLGASLAVEQGEFVALMGASGSGKSTLLNLIAGGRDGLRAGERITVTGEDANAGVMAVSAPAVHPQRHGDSRRPSEPRP